MDRKRFITTTSCDVIWTYDVDATDNPLLLPTLKELADWISTNVYGGTTVFPDRPRIAKGDMTGGSIQLSGVVGTPVVLVSGWDDSLLPASPLMPSAFTAGISPSFVSSLHDSIGGHSLRPFLDITDQGDPTIWENFDTHLHDQPNREGGIDFYFLIKERQVYIHIELGDDPAFPGILFGNAVTETEGFRNWLPSGPLISRNVYKVEDGATTATPLPHLPATNIKVNVGDFLPKFAYFTDIPPCPFGCRMKGVCSIAAGTFTELDEGDTSNFGSAEFNFEILALKPYCVDEEDPTKPCGG